MGLAFGSLRSAVQCAVDPLGKPLASVCVFVRTFPHVRQPEIPVDANEVGDDHCPSIQGPGSHVIVRPHAHGRVGSARHRVEEKSELLVHGRDGKIREPARAGTTRAGRRANAWG
jgi:hypothetical protein